MLCQTRRLAPLRCGTALSRSPGGAFVDARKRTCLRMSMSMYAYAYVGVRRGACVCAYVCDEARTGATVRTATLLCDHRDAAALRAALLCVNSHDKARCVCTVVDDQPHVVDIAAAGAGVGAAATAPPSSTGAVRVRESLGTVMVLMPASRPATSTSFPGRSDKKRKR